MPDRIALFGGSFNPPGLHHRAIADALRARFDRVIVMPCGPRPDKSATNLLPPIYRASLTEMTFAEMPRVEVELSDLEQEEFTRTHVLDSRLRAEGEVWHVVGVDLIKGGASGASEIQRTWERGEWLWNEARFAVITRPGHKFKKADLPPNHEVLELEVPGASTEIRSRLARDEDVSTLVTPRALAYIRRYGLYRAPNPSTWARGSLTNEAPALIAASGNARAGEWCDKLAKQGVGIGQASFFTVLGGDGTMLRAIREHWRARLPFYGVNAGHLGFLMNPPDDVFACDFPPADVIFRQLPMLYIEVEFKDGTRRAGYGFNDAWVERATSQSAWIEVSVNGVRRLPKLISDGALVATAAGSTAYARSMGASPLLADTPAWLLVGSNVMEPFDWKSALLSTDSTVELVNLDPTNRPMRAFIDGHDQGEVLRMKARISRAAAAELVFNANRDMAEKIAAIQFRSAGAI